MVFHLGPLSHTQTYVIPDISLFGPVTGNPNALFNNVRVYGTILLVLMSIVVFVGVKIVSPEERGEGEGRKRVGGGEGGGEEEGGGKGGGADCCSQRQYYNPSLVPMSCNSRWLQ